MNRSVQVHYNSDAEYVVIALDRGERGNALDSQLVDELTDVLDEAIAKSVRFVAFTNAGKNFCTGFDLSNLENETEGDLLLRFVRIELLLQKVKSAPLFTVAVASGRATGAGADLFTACDFRFCTPDVNISFPGAAFGIILGAGRLAGIVGPETARDIVVSGRNIVAEDARRIGLVTDVIAAAERTAILPQLNARLGRLSHETLAALKQATDSSKHAEDLMSLVRSASRKGLKSRIVAYRAARLSSVRPQAQTT